MQGTPLHAGSSICTCDHPVPPSRVLRSTAHNEALASYVADLGLSGDGVVDWALTELFDHRTGKLIGFDGQPLMIDDGSDLTDDLFGEDQRRFINRYRERASKAFRYRLQRRVVVSVMMLHFAREIHICRTSGRCAAR